MDLFFGIGKAHRSDAPFKARRPSSACSHCEDKYHQDNAEYADGVEIFFHFMGVIHARLRSSDRAISTL
jgi:hypothetical protein